MAHEQPLLINLIGKGGDLGSSSERVCKEGAEGKVAALIIIINKGKMRVKDRGL